MLRLKKEVHVLHAISYFSGEKQKERGEKMRKTINHESTSHLISCALMQCRKDTERFIIYHPDSSFHSTSIYDATLDNTSSSESMQNEKV